MLKLRKVIFLATCNKLSFIVHRRSACFKMAGCCVSTLLLTCAVAGVNVGACGERTLRLRNTLIFESKHAEIFLDRLEQVLAETK